MPLTMRPIPHALNLGAPEIYGQGPSGQGAQGTQVLEDVNMASMVGTLAQLGALSTVRTMLLTTTSPRFKRMVFLFCKTITCFLYSYSYSYFPIL